MKKLGIVSIVSFLTMIFNGCLHGSALGDIQESIWKQYISAIQEVVNLEGAEKLEGYESIAGQIGLFIAHLTSCSNDHVTVEDSLIMSDRVLVRVFYSGIIGNFGLHMCLVQSGSKEKRTIGIIQAEKRLRSVIDAYPISQLGINTTEDVYIMQYLAYFYSVLPEEFLKIVNSEISKEWNDETIPFMVALSCVGEIGIPEGVRNERNERILRMEKIFHRKKKLGYKSIGCPVFY